MKYVHMLKPRGDMNGHIRKRQPKLSPALLCLLMVLLISAARGTAQSRQGPPAQASPPPSAGGPQRTVNPNTVNQDTLLLEYRLGEEGSILWAVTRDSIDAYDLPSRTLIEQAAQQVIDLLTARLPRENETNREAFERALKTKTRLPAALEELSRMILGPVLGKLHRQRVLIVADGSLHFLPFAVLPKGKSVPLLQDHELVYLQSASVLEMIRRRESRRSPAPKRLVLFADPVFEREDPRFQTQNSELAGGTQLSVRDTTRSAVLTESLTSRLGTLRRLRFARQEADAIWASLTDEEKLSSRTILGFEADQAAALRPELAQYQYLHFATHGLLDNEHPDLSGIALSMLNRQGQAQDGFLRLIEIYNLRLNAELVTLSACETGLGKQVNGEGIINLTRGFLHAGASRVLVSLWKVDDRASARLMGRVYEGIFREKLSPAAALRKAQLSLRQDAAMTDPFFWAAFVLHGEPLASLSTEHAGTSGESK